METASNMVENTASASQFWSENMRGREEYVARKITFHIC